MRQLSIPENLMLDVQQNGGFTFHPNKSVPNVGFVVGKHNIMICNGFKPIPNDLFKLAIEEVQTEETSFIGGWFNEEEDKTYYDVVQIFQDYNVAIKVAKKRGEKAIFDLSSGKEIFV